MNNANEGWVDLGNIDEGTSPAIRARVVDRDKTLLLKNQITNIKRKIFDISSGQEAATIVGSETTLVLADVFFDTVRTGGGWDSTLGGYNFEDIVPQTSLVGVSGGKKKYMVEYRVTPASGDAFWLKRVRLTVGDALGM